MKKGVIIVVVILTLSIFTFYFNSISDIQVFKIFDTKELTFELVSNALKGDDKCLHDLANIILDNIDYKQWENDPKIKVHICKGNILSNEGEEVVVGISLPPDTGIISILEPIVDADKYDLLYTTTDMVPIDSIKVLRTPNLTHSLIFVKETLDERMGAFFKSTVIEIYAWMDNNLEVIWNGTESYTACWNTMWEENSTENIWKKLDENAIISMNENNTEIKVLSNQSYMESNYPSDNIPDDDKFKTIKTRTLTSTYYLDNELKKYILGTALLNNKTTLYDYDGINFIKKQELTDGETVKLLEDLNKLADNLINDELNYYKVLTKNGLTGYISKEVISMR